MVGASKQASGVELFDGAIFQLVWDTPVDTFVVEEK
jgi:hypothetical protein